MELVVEHGKYGTITIDAGIEAFALTSSASYGSFRIHDFAVSENKIGELVVKLLGSRLIMSLVNAVFNMKTISKDDIVCTYSDNTLTVDFTDVIKKSKAAQFVIKDRNLFDIVTLTGLVPEESGLKVCSKWTLIK